MSETTRGDRDAHSHGCNATNLRTLEVVHQANRSRPRAARVLLPGIAVAAVALTGVGLSPAGEQPASAATAAADGPVTVVAAEAESVAARAEQLAEGMDVRELAGTIVMGHYGARHPDTAASYMADNRIGGFLLMGSNVTDEEQVRDFAAALAGDPSLPALVAIDQEGGGVSRLYWDDFPAGSELAEADPAEARAAFAARGSLVARAGAGVNFGIVADATDDPSSFISDRVLGTDPTGAAERVTGAVEGEAPFAQSTLKHFPGHGEVTEDSHRTIPNAEQSLEDWKATTASPFQAGIEAGAPLVMMGHLVYPSVSDQPASLSPEWYRVLREDLGFTGVAATDDLGMLLSSGDDRYADPVGNAVSAVAAGADLVVMVVRSDYDTAGQLADGIAGAVDAGIIPETRLREAAQRVLALRLELSGHSVLLPTD